MIEGRLIALVRDALAAASSELSLIGDPPEIELERPRQKEFGDFSTNIALALASAAGRKPRQVAQMIVDNLPDSDFVSSVEVAGPGFINFYIAHGWLFDVLREVVARGDDYGHAQEPTGLSVQVEFVSANPTGPLHVGTARNAVLGDALASVLQAAGHAVEREYYFNDAGRQMDLFAESVEVRYLQGLGREAEMPEEGYRGEYLVEIGRDIATALGDSLVGLSQEERRARLLAEGSRRVLEGIRATLANLGVRFDSYFSERTLHETGAITEAVSRLRSSGHIYEKDGAVWFRSTGFGDDKDRVLIRSNGEPTYFAADCAYVVNKMSRGFDRLIYVWGADHHGTVKRLEGAAEALGLDRACVEVVLYQMVSLLRGRHPVKMSKRTGEIITLDELLEEVGPDAARFTLLSQSHDSVINFDIEEVTRQTLENPVYYVQYAHARIASILRNATAKGIGLSALEDVDLTLLTSESEVDLLREIAEFPEQVAVAAGLRAPHRLTHYSRLLAERFHHFYAECRVVSEDEALTQARLWLVAGTKQTVANVLGILGVSAPASMERTDE